MKEAFQQFMIFLRGAKPVVQIFGVIAIAAVVTVMVHLGVIPGLNSPSKKTVVPEPGPNSTTVNVYAKGIASPTDYPVSDGSPANEGKGQSALVNVDAASQKEAAVWHSLHDAATPNWTYISGGSGNQTYVRYRYYDSSDKCLEIQRLEAGRPVPTDKWVPSPLEANPHQAKLDLPLRPPPHKQADAPSTVASSGPGSEDAAPFELSLTSLAQEVVDALPPGKTVMAASFASPAGEQYGDVPSGPQFCLNPHPGTYTWNWGPVNGCFQQQFRQFSDGCTHYQVFNVCAGVWDPTINWTYCRMH